MSLSDLASLGSFVSGAAVLVSLIYLSIQVRQTEKNQRALINESYVTRVSENIRWWSEPANRHLQAKVAAGETAFTTDEIMLLGTFFRLAVLSTQAVFQQNAAGLIDKYSYDSAMLSFKGWLSQPVYRALWLRMTATTSPEFCRVIS